MNGTRRVLPRGYTHGTLLARYSLACDWHAAPRSHAPPGTAEGPWPVHSTGRAGKVAVGIAGGEAGATLDQRAAMEAPRVGWVGTTRDGEGRSGGGSLCEPSSETSLKPGGERRASSEASSAASRTASREPSSRQSRSASRAAVRVEEGADASSSHVAMARAAHTSPESCRTTRASRTSSSRRSWQARAAPVSSASSSMPTSRPARSPKLSAGKRGWRMARRRQP